MNLTAAEFRELFESVSTWGRWGDDDRGGALNYLTPERVRAAAELVRTGETVSLSLASTCSRGTWRRLSASRALPLARAISSWSAPGTRGASSRQGRWEFMFAAAPLRLVGGTGSPLNPIAIL